MMIHLIRLIPANNRLRIRNSLDFSLVAVFRCPQIVLVRARVGFAAAVSVFRWKAYAGGIVPGEAEKDAIVLKKINAL